MKETAAHSDNQEIIFSRMNEDTANRVLDLVAARDKQEAIYREKHPGYLNKAVDYTLGGCAVFSWIAAYACNEIAEMAERVSSSVMGNVVAAFGDNLSEMVSIGAIVTTAACVFGVAFREIKRENNNINRSLAQKTDTQIYRITSEYSDNNKGVHKYPDTPAYHYLEYLQSKHKPQPYETLPFLK